MSHQKTLCKDIRNPKMLVHNLILLVKGFPPTVQATKIELAFGTPLEVY